MRQPPMKAPPPSHGNVQALAGVGVEYTPDPGFTGYDQFEYQVCDLSNPSPLCAVATVTVLINCSDVSGYNLISGAVYEDANQNGVNEVETGQGGATVYLYNDNNQNGIRDAGDTQEATATTAPDGTYSFSITPVYYTPGSLTVAISQNTDDAWEKDNGGVENDKDDHEIGKIEFWTGLRFQNLNIPAGAVITNAYVAYYSSRDETNTVAAVNFFTELSSSPATFVEQIYGISSRSLSTGSVYWNMGGWFQDDLYQSPDLSSVIQEVIDLGSWSAGDNLVIVAEGLGSQKRKYRTHDKNPVQAPRLYVDYLIPGQDEYAYVVEVDPASLPGAAMLTTDNVETAYFTGLDQVDCLNDFGFFPGSPPTVTLDDPADGTIYTSLQTITLAATVARSVLHSIFQTILQRCPSPILALGSCS